MEGIIIMNSEVKIPISIAMYFIATKNKISIDKACAYLIKSLDGDSHYLTVEFVEDGMLSMDLAEIIYGTITGDCSYKDIFEWRNALIETKKQEEKLDA